MKRLRKYKNDILLLLLFSVIYIVIALILTHGEFIFASKVDFAMQHYLFPEYFRNLFYDTKDLFPDFAFHLGGGQNIYNLSYYGFLSPYILVSYLFPVIPMITYLMIVSFIIVVSSTFLFYKFLKSHHFKPSTCLVVSLLFLFASPIMYHAKRHIMFINYFPFLILGFFGVDKFIEKKKIGLLVTSITLMVFTSFYYSVSGCVVLIIYGIYQYLKKHKISDKKAFIKFFFPFAKPFLISILLSAILWVPTAYTLLSGRGEAIKNIEFWELFVPSFKALYTAYSPGITLFEFILIGILIIDKNIRKQTRFLALVVVVIFMFPIFNYILNGTLYLNAKSLIPFLPLALLLVAISLDTLLKHPKKIKVYLVLSTCLICVFGNMNDILIPKGEVDSSQEKDYQTLVDFIVKEDSSFYRIGNQTEESTSLNKVYNMKEYKSSIYSSTQNREYQLWVKNRQKNNQIYRNGMMTSISGNILADAMMGEKYIITDHSLGDGYRLKKEVGILKLYENEFSLPIIYTTKNEITKRDYQNLTYPMTVISSYADGNLEDSNILEEVSLQVDESKNISTKTITNGVFIKAKNNNKMVLTPTEDLEDKVVFVTFKNNFNRRCNHTKVDQTITINGIKNKLTCRGWKYHNRNRVFHYVLVSPKELEVEFSEGLYELGDISIYAVSKDVFLEEKNNNIIPVSINQELTKGDTIYGSVQLEEEENVVVAIPYDEGFRIEVDGEKVSYQKSVQNGMTFKVGKGTHEIKITYHAPWKNIGAILSFLGVFWIAVIGIKKKKGNVKCVK